MVLERTCFFDYIEGIVIDLDGGNCYTLVVSAKG
jgi:hypothetical protein